MIPKALKFRKDQAATCIQKYLRAYLTTKDWRMKLAHLRIDERLSCFAPLRQRLLSEAQPVIRRFWLRYRLRKAAKERAEGERREREEAARRRRMELEAEIDKRGKKKSGVPTTSGTSPSAKGAKSKPSTTAKKPLK